jgi:hypothetical protein
VTGLFLVLVVTIQYGKLPVMKDQLPVSSKRIYLEKTGIDDRRSQHPYRKLSQASDSKMQNSQLSQILAKLKQVSLIHFLTESYRRLLILRYIYWQS